MENNSNQVAKVVLLAKEICQTQEGCHGNSICQPTSSCKALKYASRVLDVGYGNIDETTKDVIAEFDRALEGVQLTPEAFEKITHIKRRCGYNAAERDLRAPVGRYANLDYNNEVVELAKFIGDYNMTKGSINERYLPYVSDVARAIIDEGWRKDQLIVQDVLDKIESTVNDGKFSDALQNMWDAIDALRAKYRLDQNNG